jgi:hypothetical protein
MMEIQAEKMEKIEHNMHVSDHHVHDVLVLVIASRRLWATLARKQLG